MSKLSAKEKQLLPFVIIMDGKIKGYFSDYDCAKGFEKTLQQTCEMYKLLPRKRLFPIIEKI